MHITAVGSIILSACTASEEADGPSAKVTTTRVAREPLTDSPKVAVARLDRVRPAALPPLPDGDDELPRHIPSGKAALPSLLDDLPGRAVMALRRDITQFNAPVASWSEIDILFFGADGRWRRLELEDLGLSDDTTYTDTYDAGQLSPDGRWWMGYARTEVILLNLATGEVRMQPIPGSRSSGARWVPGRNAIMVNGFEIDLRTRATTRTPYKSTFEVGFEPDGTALSVVRGEDGQANLVPWSRNGQRLRAVLPNLKGPRRVSPALGVSATADHFVVVQSRGEDRVAYVVADSQTGVPVGELIRTRGVLFYVDDWLDNRAILVAAEPYFLAWRPWTGELFRVTDARSLGGYWTISTALGR